MGPMAMNLAYYRYRAGPRLRDLGFEVIPELPLQWRFLLEIPFKILLSITIVMLFAAQLRATRNPTKVVAFLFNALCRFGVVFAMAHSLRACSFLATTIPGSAVHCLPDFDWQRNQPKVPLSLFPNPGFPSKNCGDLIFSGHMSITTICYNSLLRYSKNMYGLTSTSYSVLV